MSEVLPISKRRSTDEGLSFKRSQHLFSQENHQNTFDRIDQILAEEGSYFPAHHFINLHENFEAYISEVPSSARIRVTRVLFDAATLELFKPKDLQDFTSPVRKALVQAFELMPYDPLYEKYMAERDAVFQDRLFEDAYVQNTYTYWDTYSDKDRGNFLRYVAALQDEVYSHETLRFEETKNFIFENKPEEVCGYLCDADIFINTSEKYDWGNLRIPFETLIHEKRHDHQRQIAKGASEGKLDHSSPFYHQGLMYREYFTPHGSDVYFDRKTFPDAYWAHPIEREARLAETIAHDICRLLKPRKPAASHSILCMIEPGRS